MEYLHHYVTKADAPIHFYLSSTDDYPDRIFFTYAELVRNIDPKCTRVHCFDGSGKIVSEFFVFRGLSGETIISKDSENPGLLKRAS